MKEFEAKCSGSQQGYPPRSLRRVSQGQACFPSSHRLKLNLQASVSWPAGAVSGEMGGHVAHFSGWEHGRETAPGGGLVPAPFLTNYRCHPVPPHTGELTSGPEDKESQDTQAARTLGDQGLSLLIQHWGNRSLVRGGTCPRT